MKKKGLSEVISMTLAILLVLVVGVSIYTFSSSFINNQKNNMDSSLNPYLSASIDDVSVQPTGSLATLPPFPSGQEEQKIIITITRTDNEYKNIIGTRFILTDKDGKNYIYDSNIPPEETGIPKSYEMTNAQVNLADFSQIDKVSISFILAEDKTTQILAEKTLQ